MVQCGIYCMYTMVLHACGTVWHVQYGTPCMWYSVVTWSNMWYSVACTVWYSMYVVQCGTAIQPLYTSYSLVYWVVFYVDSLSSQSLWTDFFESTQSYNNYYEEYIFLKKLPEMQKRRNYMYLAQCCCYQRAC